MQPPVNPDRLQDRIEQARAMVVGAIIGVPAINALATVGGCAALSHGSVASLAALVAGALALTGVCVMVGVQGYRDLRDGVTSSR